MVDPRAKGAKAETVIRDALRTLTGLGWERTPGSGALDPKHKLKGDLYVPDRKNLYCVECKHYAEDHLTSKLLTSKSPQLIEWWSQAVRQGSQVGRKPLLIFKFDRSKLFVAYEDIPSANITNMLVLDLFFVSILEDWVTKCEPVFVE